MSADIQIVETSPNCEVCHRTENLKTCSRCHSAFYCGREHQVLHWAVHKRICKDFRTNQDLCLPSISRPPEGQSIPLVSSTVHSPSSPIASNNVPTQAYAAWCPDKFLDNTVHSPSSEVASPERTYSEWDMNNLVTQDPSVSSQTIDQTSAASSETSDSNELQIDSELLALTAKYLLSGNYAGSSDDSMSLDYDLTSVTENILDDSACASSTLPADVRMQEVELASSLPFEHVCSSIVHDLNVHGICVMDKFLGSEVGDHILAEVKTLFQRGIFQKGQLVNPNMWKSTDGIRGDFILWVSGTEQGCEYIGSLIRRLDDVMNRCGKMKDNGILSRYKLNKRTKAMIACYPGNGTHYKKHVDNPDGDGRCITCIYYLNKNWNFEKHGGLLRMFPTSHEDEIANIEPLFDRMLFFWSDRRNPHEVLASYAVRFAITVWYFDNDERQLALIRSSLQQKQ